MRTFIQLIAFIAFAVTFVFFIFHLATTFHLVIALLINIIITVLNN